MKRIISVILAFLLVFLLSGCTSSTPEPQIIVDTIVNNTPDTEVTPEPDNKNETPDNSQPSSPPAEVPKNEESQQPTTDNSGEQRDENTSVKNENPKIENTQQEIVSEHTALKKEDLYQYSFLNNSEKRLYDTFYSTALAGINNIDIEAMGLNKNVVLKVYSAFLADNPQFFYIAKHYSYTISQRRDIVLEFTLYYSDGITEDAFDDEGNPTTAADRNIIKSQINEFSKDITDFLATVPSNVRDVEKEKKIYDFILENVKYDSQLADQVKDGEVDAITHSFSAYGAMCKGVAVCEGYAKLFQYLCYQVGINATQVHGVSGTNHMWNAVLIDGKWYMADPTWDDSDKPELHYHKYFNITTAQLTEDHTIDSDKLEVPACDSTEAAFYKVFALVPSNNEMPSNYKEIIDLAIKNNEKYICIYRGNSSANLEDFINTKIYSRSSPFRAYVNEKGYNVTLGSTYLITSKYYYIQIA